MTILSDRGILSRLSDGEIEITPNPAEQAIQPASVDLTLGDEFRWPDGREIAPGADGTVWINPGDFFLGTTVERVSVPADLVARVEGKSSLGRMGILVHATAGFIDPGFMGQITLEFTNLSTRPFQFNSGMYICQISFEELDQPAARPYGHPGLKSSYQGQVGTKESKYA